MTARRILGGSSDAETITTYTALPSPKCSLHGLCFGFLHSRVGFWSLSLNDHSMSALWPEAAKAYGRNSGCQIPGSRVLRLTLCDSKAEVQSTSILPKLLKERIAIEQNEINTLANPRIMDNFASSCLGTASFGAVAMGLQVGKA